MKTAVLTDSTAYIPDHLIEEKNIYVAPLSVTFGQDTYREFYDITTEEFYEKVKAEKICQKHLNRLSVSLRRNMKKSRRSTML